jgi:ABC-type oligopeptide transport system ATPase subunit
MDDDEHAQRRLVEHDVLDRLGEIYAPLAGAERVEAAALLVARGLDALGADTAFVVENPHEFDDEERQRIESLGDLCACVMAPR